MANRRKDNLKIFIMQAVDAISLEVEEMVGNSYDYIKDLYAIEMYVCSLFGQKMEQHLEEMRREQ